VGLIILLLGGFAATAWIIERRCATRNWDFKERSLKYLNDVERKRREIAHRTRRKGKDSKENAAWLARIFSRIQAAPIFTVENAIHTPGIVTMTSAF